MVDIKNFINLYLLNLCGLSNQKKQQFLYFMSPDAQARKYNITGIYILCTVLSKTQEE